MKQKKNKNKKKNKKKIEKVSNVEIERKPKKEEVGKNIDKEEGKASQKNRKIRKFLKIILAIGAGTFSVIEILPPIIEVCHELLISKTKFSLEKNVNEDGSLTWKICNLGEAISDANIYPSMYVTLFFYDEKKDKDIDITFEILNYYDENNYYDYSDGTFYIKDTKESELNDFIEKYINLFHSNEDEYGMYSIMPYFTLNYRDYREKKHNKIYTLSEKDFIDDNLDREIFGGDFSKLDEISNIPAPDIIAPSKFEDACVISINYKNATSQQVIETEQDYNDYLFSVILDLLKSKDKPIDEMYGTTIISNGNLWVRDMDTGELVWVMDNVEDVGFLE